MYFIKVKVHPDSKEYKVCRKSEDSYELWVKEPAERGRANEAARKILSEFLKIRPENLAIVKGAHSRSKIMKIL
ncbi:MAG: DUF167 domain-containing protein [Elusimicrobia bacterium]|nr:DUF167 domain-containing protein [Elusimicrobiota bacterium]